MRYTLHKDASHFSLLRFFYMALSQYTKKALQRSIKCGILCILIPKHGFNIIRTSIVFLTLSRTQNNWFCLYIGGTSFNSHSGILVRPSAWKKDLLWHFFPGTGPHHPTPPHIYVKKNLGLKIARTASN